MEPFYVMLESLGCDKNLVDSEMMLGLLADRGYYFTQEPEKADAIIVNTCCFILDAKEESIQALIEYGALKEDGGRLQFLIAAGCLAQRYKDEIHKDLPEVDAVVGSCSFDRIADILDDLRDGKTEDAWEKPERLIYGKRRVVSTDGHYSFLKIAEGCDKNCTYCIIPAIRGRYRSVPMEALVAEAEKLVEGGVRELVLVAQETTLYGTDLYGKKMLPELLRRLCRIEELSWVRLMYCYPEEIDDALIEVMAQEPKLCHYLDMPIQHCSDRILKRMGRKTSRESLENLLNKLRERIPDICIRTTLITGFPGETAEDVAELKDFVRRMRFDRLGVFPYSEEEGTVAAKMEPQVPEEEREERRGEIMELQQTISQEIEEGLVGCTIPCIVEGMIPEEGLVALRSYRDAPDVDGYVFVETERFFMSGTMVNARITGTGKYCLYAEIED